MCVKRQRERETEGERETERERESLPRGLRYPEEKDGTNQYQGGDASQVPVPVTQTVRQTYAINVHVLGTPCTVYVPFLTSSLYIV